jgi:hypothetical protein
MGSRIVQSFDKRHFYPAIRTNDDYPIATPVRGVAGELLRFAQPCFGERQYKYMFLNTYFLFAYP